MTAPDDGWTLYGPVYDRKATVSVIQALQAKGLQVRVVKKGNQNIVYTKKAGS